MPQNPVSCTGLPVGEAPGRVPHQISQGMNASPAQVNPQIVQVGDRALS